MSENNSNSASGQCDPGWNDPPKLQYNSSQTGKKKLNLNKRIAFPLHGLPATSKPTAIVQPSPSSLPLTTTPMLPSQPPIAIVPPMPQTNPPPTQRVPPLNANETSPQTDDHGDVEDDSIPEGAREHCIGIFQNFANKIQQSNHIRLEEVQRRLELMKYMWLSDVLTSSLQRKLINIAKAMEDNKYNEAMEYHRALVVDHSNVCHVWAVALRQIIATIKSGSDDASTQTPTGDVLIPNVIPSDTHSSESQSESVDDVQHI